MPLIKARSSSIIDSVDLRGQPTAETAAQSTNTNQLASTAFVRTAIAELINSSPALLDTLAELASAINNDENFSTTITNSIATKVALDGSVAMTGNLTLSGAPVDDLHAVTKLYVDDLIDNQMIYSTDDVTEGQTNLYYTDVRVRSAVSLASDNTTVLSYDQSSGQFSYNHPTSDGVLEGSTNLYFSQLRARQSISMNSDDGTIISYSGSTGEITFTTPNTDKIVEGQTNIYFTTTRARNSISNGSNIAYDSGTGVISTQAAVWSVNGQEHAVVLDTDDITEGSTNLYFTNIRSRGAVSLTTDDSNILSYNSGTGTFTFVTPNTDAIDEGQANLYFTNTRVRNAISASGDISYNSGTGNFSYSTPTTDGVNEGATNLYFLDSRARNAISLTSDNQDVLSYNASTGTFTFSLGDQTTDDVAEGLTNLYFLDSRARAAISVTSSWDLLSYNSTSGELTLTTPDTDDVTEGATNLYHTTTRVRNAISATQPSGDGSFAYDNTSGVFTYTGPDDADYRQAVSAYRDSGDGDLQYDSATGVFTYTGPSAGETRAHFSATTSGTGFGGLSYDSATGAFTYAKVTSGNIRGELSATTATGVTYDNATGVIALAAIPNNSLANSEVVINSKTIALGGTATLNADDIAEAVGGTNKYFTEARFDTSLAGKTTDDVTEGSNLYYTQTRFNNAFAAKSTTDLAEGTNEYFTESRARNSLVAGTGVTYTSSTGTIAIGQPVGTTDNVTFNDLTVSGDLTVQGTLTSINSTTVDIADINLTLAKGATNAASANGAGITIEGPAVPATFTYTSADDSWNVNKNVNVTSVVVQQTVTATQGFVGDLTGDVTGDVTGDLFGNADTATVLQTARNIQGVSFDGSANITVVTAGTGVTVTGTAVAIGQSVGTSDNVTFNTVTADLTGNVTGNVTGTVSDISNHTTDTLTEGTTNLYATATRVRQALSASDTGGDGSFSYDSSTGTFEYTGPSASEARAHFSAATSGTGHGGLSYDNGTGAFTFAKVTSSNIRGEVSANKVSGDGNFSYDGSTGVFSYTGPSAGDTRAHFSASSSTGVTYDQATGVFSLASIPNSSLANNSITINGATIALGSNDTLDTDDIGEGATNLYYTDTRARTSLSKTTSNASIFDYDATTGAFTFDLAAMDTDDVAEGSGNLYYLDSRARASISLSGGGGSGGGGGSYTFSGGNGDWTYANFGNTSPASQIDFGDTPGTLHDLLTAGSVAVGTQITVTGMGSGVVETTSGFTLSGGVWTASINIVSGDPFGAIIEASFTVSGGSGSGTTVLAYDNATGVFTYTAPNTDDVTEGATNEYFTLARARTAISLTTDNTDALSYDNTTGTFNFTLNSVDTDEIAEGATNLYFTTTRARNTINNGANIDYDASTGTISTQAAVWSVNTQTGDVVLDTDDISEGSTNLYFLDSRARSAITLTTDDSNILSYNTGTGALTFTTPTTDSIDEGAVNLYYTDTRADDRIAAASIRDLSDVDSAEALQDGYTLVWSSSQGKFVPQNVSVTATTLNFTGDSTTTSFSTGVEVTSIDNTQVYINGLIQAPTYSYTLSTVSGVSSIVFDTAPETNDYIFVRVSSTSTLTAGGILNESSNIDGGTY